MSRIESGRMTLKEEEFSFHELLDQINVIINGQCVDKGLNYECKVIGKSDDYYVSDSIKLKQVLINILGNAVKFTEAPGSVTFTVEQTASSENHRILRFVIRDTGIGMSKEFISKIFEAFSQEKEGSSNEYGSTGLGMAITKNIVTMMNGDIQVESEKGVGSTFTVCVTLKSSERSAQKDNSKTLLAEQQALIDNDEQKKPTNEKLAGCRVLVVEDMEINAEILMKQLEMKEIQSEHAENGQRAVDMFSEHPAGYYDIILMDVRMPVLDGLKATRVIRGLERSDAKLIPIIAITANAFDEDVQQSMKAGMNAHLSKPIEPEHLYDILCQFVRNENENTAS
jgi:CheY-like chemotaxis protein